jgi:hypothetical protein
MHNRTIQIRLTRQEKDRIIFRMRSQGHRSLSAWIRQQLLTERTDLEKKVDALYHHIIVKGHKTKIPVAS